jgi:hypothetical protein
MTMIDRDELLKKIAPMGLSNGSVLGHHSGTADVIAEMIQNAPTIDPASCLNWHIGKPPEHKSIFAKFKGTKKWLPGMFETVSNEVLVTIELPNKTRIVTVSNTTDGKWTGCCNNFPGDVVAWTEKPAPAPKGVFV